MFKDFSSLSFFEGGLLVALSPSGQPRWRKNLVDEYGPIESRHGLAASLEADADQVFVWVERGEEPYVLAIRSDCGDVVWEPAGIGATAWSSPRWIPVDGTSQLVCSGGGKIIALNPGSGERLWELA